MKERRGRKEGEREGGSETKLFGSSGFIYPCTFLTSPTQPRLELTEERKPDVLTGYVLTAL